MTISYNPRIITDGLVMCLDAGNRKSYPGSGTTWADISGGGNTGTLTNGPTYSSANGGSIVFDGTNDYETLPTNLLVHHTGNPFTFSIWFKTLSTGIILGQQNTSTPNSATGYVPAIYVGTDGKLYTSCFWGGAVSNQSISPVAVDDGNWYNITVTFSSGSQISYLNGVSYATLAKTQTSYSSTYYYFLGSGSGSSWTNFPASPYFNGSISNALYYTKALTAAEIRQNYNALKPRYPTIPPADPISLLLHMDGSNGSTSLIDSSSANRTITVTGSGSLRTSISKFGTASYYAGNTIGDYISTSGTYTLKSNDFTFECWWYPTSFTNGYKTFCNIVAGDGANYTFATNDDGTSRKVFIYRYTGGVVYITDGYADLGTFLNQWNHVALVRFGNTIYIYFNGVLRQSGAFNYNLGNATMTLCNHWSGSGSEMGYVDEALFTIGPAKYTSNFTPPTSPFLSS
jgi:hypothetical protein